MSANDEAPLERLRALASRWRSWNHLDTADEVDNIADVWRAQVASLLAETEAQKAEVARLRGLLQQRDETLSRAVVSAAKFGHFGTLAALRRLRAAGGEADLPAPAREEE